VSDYDWGERLPRLAGTRIDLRWMTREDRSAAFEIFGDPEVMRYWSSPAFADENAALRLIEEIHELFANRQLFEWAICLRDDDRMIGTCTVYQLRPEHRRAEIGFALARAQWGQGYAREALGLLLRFCFEELQLHRLEADVDPRNTPSLRLLEALGFQREGLLRQRWHHSGELQDALFLGLLKPEWKR
jgi:RimJ/RimL family protein N-acetyltransferase